MGVKQFSLLEKGKSRDIPWSSVRLQGQLWCWQLREFHLLCCFILCLSHHLWHSTTTAGPHVLCVIGIRNRSCSASISTISLKEVNLCWNEKLGSFFEPKLSQPDSKVFTDIKAFFLDCAALKTSETKKEKHLHWFSSFNTQEWKSVKSQSLYHHKKNAVSLQMTRTQAACKVSHSWHQQTQVQHSYRLLKHLLFTNISQHRALAISHIFLYVLCSICFLDQWFTHLKKQCPTSDLFQHRNTSFFPAPKY